MVSDGVGFLHPAGQNHGCMLSASIRSQGSFIAVLITFTALIITCAQAQLQRTAAAGVPVSYRLPTTGPLPQTYRVTLAIVGPKDPDWIISQFAAGVTRTVTAENGGKFSELWDGLDDNFMPVPLAPSGPLSRLDARTGAVLRTFEPLQPFIVIPAKPGASGSNNGPEAIAHRTASDLNKRYLDSAQTIVADGRLLVQREGALAAYEEASGKPLWQRTWPDVEPIAPVLWDPVHPALTVTAGGVAVPVHRWSPPGGGGKAYAVFDCDGPVEVVIAFPEPYNLTPKERSPLMAFAANDPQLKPTPEADGKVLRVTMRPGHTILLQQVGTFICALARDADAPRAGEAGVATLADLGVKAGGEAPVTKALQKAIDTVASRPAGSKGRVLLAEPGVYITGTLFMRDGVRLHLPSGAILRGAVQPEEWRWKSGPLYQGTSAMIFFGNDVETGQVVGVRGAAITGRGVIDGWGSWFRRDTIDGKRGNSPGFYEGDLTNRARLIMALRAEDCRVEGVTLRNPTFWTAHIVGARGFVFRDLRVLSNHRLNGDGLNFDSSTDGLIDNCAMATGDDSHCLKNEGVSGILAPNERITMRNSIACDFGKGVKFGWNFTKAIDCTYENNVLLSDFSIAIGRKYPSGVSPKVAEVRNLTLRGMRITGALDIYLAGKLLDSYSMDRVTIEDTEAARINFSNTSHLTFRRFTLGGQRVTALDQIQPFLTDCTDVTLE